MSASPSRLPQTREASASGSSRRHSADAQHGQHGQHGRTSRGGDTTMTLACNACRQKKVKCILENSRCRRCNRLGIDCAWPSQDQRKCPSSKTYIRALENRIASLEAALAEARATISNLSATLPSASDDPSTESWAISDTPSPLVSSDDYSRSTDSQTPGQTLPSLRSLPLHTQDDNIISRLCGRQWKLNSDEEGQYRFFGPTCSLHFTEAVSSSLFESGCRPSIPEDASLDGLIDRDTHEHLLDTYWRYQHNILQVFDKEEFLDGLKTRKAKYFSKALLYGVYVCAARISDRPNLRAMVLPGQDEVSETEPYLMGIAAQLVDQELQHPRITTIQALLLLSVIYYTIGKDAKGWVMTTIACSLAIDFGLHMSDGDLAAAKLSSRDIKVRRTTYWGCIVFDRLWARYLGRPVSLRRDDYEYQLCPPSSVDVPWETRLASSWARLVIIAGNISDALNRVSCTPETLQVINAQLQDWHSHLDPEFRYSRTADPSILLLHMEYSSCRIHLHRPTANFGSPHPTAGMQDSVSRRICLENAERIASIITDYRSLHGNVSTISGAGLHITATAATVLIASIAERNPANTSLSQQMGSLKACIVGLCEMEKTYTVARRVRRIIRLILSVCHIDVGSAAPAHPALHSMDLAATADLLGTAEDGSLGLFDTSGVGGVDFTGTEVATMVGELGPPWTEERSAMPGQRGHDIVYNLDSFL